MHNSPLVPPPPPDAPVPAREPTTPTNWVGAVAAALAIQVGAAVVMLVAFVIVFVAAFSTFGDSSAETPAYILFALPVGAASIGLYVFSGHVASRIAGDGRGWLMLVLGPAILLALRIGTVLLLG